MQRGNGGYDMKRVLIADDEPIERMIVTRTIQKYFPEELAVVSAVNGYSQLIINEIFKV